jgi:indole-3-glycerol phosphate synthase
MSNILSRIVKAKKAELKIKKEKMPVAKLLAEIMKAPANRNFRDVFENNDFTIIGEIKKKSPSSGTLRGNLSVKTMAQVYEAAGAGALSIVTDKKFFDGRLEYIEEAKKYVSLPVLRKDFVIDEYQIYESRFARADALLLIASILDGRELNALVRKTRSLNMTPVVEVHSPADLKKAVRSGVDIIGVNTRNLKTFKTDFHVLKNLVKTIPKDKMIICESGMKEQEDILSVRIDPRVKGVLIGTMFMKMPDRQIKQSIRDMLSSLERE